MLHALELPQSVQIWATARNFALHLDREYGFQNMAQAQPLAGFGLKLIRI